MLQLFYGETNDYESETQIGVDEVGRGCLAGPVVSAAVVWDTEWLNNNLSKYEKELSQIKDSKKLSEKKRKEIALFIKAYSKSYGISFIEPGVIDKINILKATYEAMHKAIENTIERVEGLNVDRILVDGPSFKNYMNKSCVFSEENEEQLLFIPHTCIVSGDNKYLSIASASILAKVARDDYMVNLCKEDSNLGIQYDWNNNKGYGTKKHIEGIEKNGLTKHHRKTFGLCKRFT